jgi:HK97 family phage major capsid protein
VTTRADQIRTRQAAIKADLDALEQVEEPTDEHHVRTDALLQEFDELTEEIGPLVEREQKIAAVRAAMADQANREPAVPAQGTGPDVIVRTRRDPFEDLDQVRSGIVPASDVRARALTAIEQYAARTDTWGLAQAEAEEATRKVEALGKPFGTAVARQMLQTGAPEYLAAFEQYLSDPRSFASRAAMSLTAANGGYLVPFTLDPTIILTNNGSANPYRQAATVRSTATNDWNGVTSAGITAEWTTEGTEAADASPTVGQLKITPQKADAYLFGSFEVLEDSDFSQQLPLLLGDAKDRLEEAAFAVGTGTGQPKGVMVGGTALAAASGTAATGPTAASIYSMLGALPARWRGPRSNLRFVGTLKVLNTLRNVAAFSGATTSIVNDAGPVPTLLGIPFLESTSVVSTYANGNAVIALGDMSQYYIVDRVGMSVIYDPVVLGANRRPSGQGAWYAFWRVGADVSTAGAFRVLTLTT